MPTKYENTFHGWHNSEKFLSPVKILFPFQTLKIQFEKYVLNCNFSHLSTCLAPSTYFTVVVLFKV